MTFFFIFVFQKHEPIGQCPLSLPSPLTLSRFPDHHTHTHTLPFESNCIMLFLCIFLLSFIINYLLNCIRPYSTFISSPTPPLLPNPGWLKRLATRGKVGMLQINRNESNASLVPLSFLKPNWSSSSELSIACSILL